MALVPGMEGINWLGILGPVMYWLGWGLMSIAVMVGMWVGFNLSQYTIRAFVFPLYGSGKDGVYSMGTPKMNSIRWTDRKTLWKRLKPYGNKQKVQPFDAEFIYPGKKIFAFEIGDRWIPAKVNLTDLNNENGLAQITPVPSYLRSWEIITHKQIDMELQSEDFWAKNKDMMMAFFTGIGILIAVCVTVYFTYKYAGGGREVMSGLTQSLNNFMATQGSTVIPQG